MKPIRSVIFLMSLVTIIAVSTGQGAETPAGHALPDRMAFEAMYKSGQALGPHDFVSFDEAVALMKTHKDYKRRSVAGAPEATVGDVAEDVTKLRMELQGIKKSEPGAMADQLDAIIVKYDMGWSDQYSPALKFHVANLAVLRTFRSIAYRTAALFEPDGIKAKSLVSPVENYKYRAAHSYAMNFVASAVKGVDRYLPAIEWQAMKEYLTLPSEVGMNRFNGKNKVIRMAKFQTYLLTEVFPAIVKANDRVLAIYQGLKADAPILVDNRILYSSAQFATNYERLQLIEMGPAELASIIAGNHATIHNLFVYCAYNHADSIDIWQKMGVMRGFDVISPAPWKGSNGITDQERAKVIKGFSNYLTLRTERVALPGEVSRLLSTTQSADHPIGNLLMIEALVHLRQSVAFGENAWETIKNSPGNFNAWLDPSRYQGYGPLGDLVAAQTRDIVSSNTSITSALNTSEVVQVNFPELYVNPPRDVKAFLPTSFNTDAEIMSVKVKGKDVKYRNYTYGSAKTWDNAKFEPYFPGAGTKPNTQFVPAALRAISQSFGGYAIAGPIQLVTM